MNKKARQKRLENLALTLLDFCGGELTPLIAKDFYHSYNIPEQDQNELYSKAEQLWMS